MAAAAARAEDGYTILVALLVLIVTVALATVALTATLDSRSHATRDLRSQRALQAADAGLNSGLYRLNQINLANFNFTGGLTSLSTLADCVIPKATVNAQGYAQITGFTFQTQASLATGACPLPSASGVGSAIPDTVKVGNHAFYEMQQLGGATTTGSVTGPNVVLHPKIVSVGVEDAGNSATCSASASTVAGAVTSGCSVRRVMATLAPIDPFQVVESAGNLTLRGLTIAVTGDMRTNGSLAVPGAAVCVVVCLPAAATLTGTNLFGGSLSANITYGGSLVPPAGVFARVLETLTPATGSVSRQAITINDSGCPSACVKPSLPSGVTASTLGGTNGAATAYDATKNTVTMTGSTMTFTPGDYVFCDFNVTGGTVKTNIPAASTTPVRIFIDSPTSTRCSSNGLGASQGNFKSTVGVSNLVGGAISLAGSSQFQIYLVGNGTANGTSVNIGGSLVESMFLYAPMSSVTVTALTFEGNLIGNNVDLTAPTILQNIGLNNYSLANNVGVFHVSQYTECSPVYPLPSPDPTVGC
jgi:Tfp pilus assembly protein PilX